MGVNYLSGLALDEVHPKHFLLFTINQSKQQLKEDYSSKEKKKENLSTISEGDISKGYFKMQLLRRQTISVRNEREHKMNQYFLHFQP